MSVAVLAVLLAWVGLLLFRGGFWKADQRLNGAPDREHWPDVVAVIPARDEAPTIGATVASLLGQDYPGRLHVVVIDDNSTDGTAAAAGISDRLTTIAGQPLPAGWTGKLWAVHQGIMEAVRQMPDARYLLLTDADILHEPGNLRRLVDKAEWDSLDLVSLMVHLRCESFWERLLIPAFVFFFQKLYPFPWVNDPDRRTAGAAGGCMLVRRETLEQAGGIAAIRDRVIDDCALAALLKKEGPIWLGLARDGTRSLRAYESLGDVWRMVARTAFVQLDRSVFKLVGTVAGMAFLYLLPPLGALAGHPSALLAWLLMAYAYGPTLVIYRRPAWESLLLPVAAFLYTLMTLDSARRHWLGKGGAWKGRTYR
ncbi:MAG: glycosyltransferase [Magnetospirillum sp. WYHS-4]